MRHLRLLTACLSLFVLFSAQAQIPPDRLKGAASMAGDLQFPDKVSSLGFFASPAMAIYKPDGNGPFPALVLHHQCGGLRNANGNWQNMSMLEWARTAVARGFVAMQLDSLGSRGVDTVCLGPKGGVNFMRGVRDAHQAADHLRKLDFVDKARVAHVGFSWGGMVAVAGSGKNWGTALAGSERFAAAVSFYPGCFAIRSPAGPAYELVNNDIDLPLLVLMGDKDTETPPEECVSKLQAAKDAGAPVQWHTYPDATHCWDCKNLNNLRKTDFRGTRVEYRYSEAITQDSEKRMFEFLETTLKIKKP